MFTLPRRFLSVCALLMVSSPSFAGLSEFQLENRLNQLMIYSSKGLDLPALEREAAYERANLPLDARAQVEGEIMVQKLKEAAIRTYQSEIDAGQTPTAARSVVRANMDEDMHLLAPEFREDLRSVVEEALKNPTLSSTRPSVPAKLLATLRRLSQERLAVLAQGPSENSDLIAMEKQNEKSNGYKTRASLVAALVDDMEDSESWTSSSNTTARSSKTRGHEEVINAQVGVEFLGVKLSAGPVFNFKKYITTHVDIKGNGFSPLFDAKGTFDFIQRDRDGKVRMNGGKPVRRYMILTCEVEATVSSEAALKGGFKILEAGAEGQVTSVYTNNISMSSRRVYVPDTIDNKIVNLQMLASICHNDFLSGKVSNGRTVKQNLDTTIRNLISGVTYVNPAIKCVKDEHCIDWYNKKVLTIHKNRTIPRCIQEKNNPSVFACRVRGSDRANCTVVKNKKVVSSGMFEYPCDRGYTCETTKEGYWGGFLKSQWFPAQGRCISDVAYLNLQ